MNVIMILLYAVFFFSFNKALESLGDLIKEIMKRKKEKEEAQNDER